MRLVPFEKSQWQNGLELDFLRRLELVHDDRYTVKKPANERLSWAALEYLNEHLKPEFGSKRYWLAITLLDKYSLKADNEYLSNTYNNGEPLFFDPLPELDQPWQAFKGIEKSELRRMDALFGRFS